MWLAQVGWLGLGWLRVGLAPGWAGSDWASSGWAGSGWLEFEYCILLDSISGTALLDVFTTSPARSAGLVGIKLYYFSKPKNSRTKRNSGVVLIKIRKQKAKTRSFFVKIQ